MDSENADQLADDGEFEDAIFNREPVELTRGTAVPSRAVLDAYQREVTQGEHLRLAAEARSQELSCD